MKIKRKNASIIIIGNEILSGKTLDTNSNYIAKKLRLKGIKCNSISVIPDDERTIIQKVNELKNSSDYIFTTGGIGPTHDDITAKSISKAGLLFPNINAPKYVHHLFSPVVELI